MKPKTPDGCNLGKNQAIHGKPVLLMAYHYIMYIDSTPTQIS